jgi:hypothetical protein
MNSPSLAIDDCKYLYLDSISEPDEGGILLVIKEASAGGEVRQDVLESETIPELRAILTGCLSIEHGLGCKVFKIYWSSYIAYAVENESYALGQPDGANGTGRLFIEYTKSAYLDYLGKTSFASPGYPGAYKHWAVLCLDHIVNVAATDGPLITMSCA